LSLLPTEDIYKNIIEASPYPVYLCSGENFVVTIANPATLKAWDKDHSVIGKPFIEALPELADQPFLKLLQNVYQTGIPYTSGNERADMLVEGATRTYYFSFTYQPLFDGQGKVTDVICFATDVTEVERARINAVESKQILYNIVKQAPVGICILKGSPLQVQVVNDNFLELIGRKQEDFDNQSYWGAIPEAAPIYEPITDNVVLTGETYYAKEHEIILMRNGVEETVFADFVYEPIKDFDGSTDAILVVATDVTTQVKARKKVELAELTLRLAIEAGNVGTWNMNPITKKLTVSARVKELFDFYPEQEMTLSNVIAQVTEEYREIVASTIENTIKTGVKYDLTYTIKGYHDQKIRWIKTIGTIIYDKSDTIASFTGVVMDVTDQKNSIQELQRLNDELAAAIEEESSANEELVATNEELQLIQQKVMEMNGQLEERVTIRTAELATSNQELGLTNEELAVMNEELAATNEELQQTQENLHELNYQLEARVERRTKDLSESEERFRTMAEGSGILITVTDEFGIDIYYSKAWVEFTGRLLNKLLSDGWEDLIHPDDLERYQDAYILALRDKISYTTEFRLLNNENEYHWLLENGNPRFRSDGTFAGYVSSCADINELKKDEQRKNDFIGMVSHELKTPLTSLNGYLQLLQRKAKKNDDDFSTNALDTANKQVKKMTAMINGFLNVSRLESGKIVLNKSNFRLDELVKSIVEESRFVDLNHHITYKADEPIELFADEDKIGSVLSNLLSNAVKYAPNNKNIEVHCSLTGGMAVVCVKDEGMGIKQEDLALLFDRYYRVESNNTISGFGIGLYLSAEIVERHNGKIWAESEPGKGSRFYFSLPLK